MRNLLFLTLLIALPAIALADGKTDCAASAGSYLSGTVTTKPTYKHRMFKKGVELSYTHVTVKSDDGQIYDVFATSNDEKDAKQVPYPFNNLHVKDHVKLCSQLYTDGTKGFYLVHINCEGMSSRWFQIINANGTVNYYCD